MNIFQLGLLSFVIFQSSCCIAGGSSTDVKILDIKTISQKKHQIQFVLAEKNAPINRLSFPRLIDCSSVTLTIDYQEPRPLENVMLWLSSAYIGFSDIKQLNQNIVLLRQYLQQKVIFNDIEAYHEIGKCQLLSKTIEIFYVENKVYLQPIRHRSKPSIAIEHHR